MFDDYIARYPGFPKEGITFYDISPVLENAEVLSKTVALMSEVVTEFSPDFIAGVDARGFLFATPIAVHLGLGALMIRKQGKLPGVVSEACYDLEYGTATLSLQKDRQIAGKRIVLVDDLLATGGTLRASSDLIEQADGTVAGAVVLIELTALKGRDKLSCPVKSFQQYAE